jgi:hypothetical protein
MKDKLKINPLPVLGRFALRERESRLSRKAMSRRLLSGVVVNGKPRLVKFPTREGKL